MTAPHDSIPPSEFNIGHLCTRRHCENGRGDKLAMAWISPRQERKDYTFAGLEEESNRAANALSALGLRKGDVIFTFLPRVPEQFFVLLGALKLQLVTGTLFSNFGEEALLDRLGDARAKCVVTRQSLARRIMRIRDRLPDLRHILLIDGDGADSDGIIDYRGLSGAASASFTVTGADQDAPSLLHYTSGSTGKPKGVLHRHKAILHLSRSAEKILSLTPDDRFWCTADQGWVTGTSYGVIAPWSLGVSQVHYGGGYDAAAWLELLDRERVTVWYTAPTALRMLMRDVPEEGAGRDFGALRHIFSVGEPLNPEVIRWGRRCFGREIYDTWFQTETGGIMISNRPGMDVRPGSMGKPLEGIEAAVIDEEGREVPPGETGQLCIRPGWPSMFTTYLNRDEVYRQKFKDGYYCTGDTACRDGDGYFWFMGRSDDIINSAGHLVSPFEVESALIECEEVAESGVIGVPDQLLFEKVVAYVSLREPAAWSRETELKLRLHVCNRVSPIASPREIIAIDSIPKNTSGKIMRRVLKAWHLGTDAGDTSTMEV